MRRDSWRTVTAYSGCECSAWLHEAAVESWAITCAIPRFFIRHVPKILRALLGELNEFMIAVCRITYHLAKFLAAVGALLAVLFLPVVAYPGWLTATWLALAFCGAAWGFRRQQRRRSAGQGAAHA